MKKLFLITVLNLIFLTLNCSAQNKNIDSLLTQLKKDKADTSKVTHSYQLCWEYTIIGLYDTAIHYGNSALQLAQQLLELTPDKTGAEFRGIKKGIANSYNTIGIAFYYQGFYPKTLEYWLKALKIDDELKDKKGKAKRLGNIGAIYYAQGDYPKALDYYFKSLKVFEELRDKNGMAIYLGNIGLVYWNQGIYSKSLDYYFKALKIAEELGNKNSVATILGNIGSVYKDKAPLQQSPKGAEEMLDIALDYYFKALKMDKIVGNKNGIAFILGNIGSIYTFQKKYEEAERYLSEGLKMDKEIGALKSEMDVENFFYDLYEKTSRFKLALEHYKKAKAIKDTIFGEENKKQLVRKEMNYEFDKKEAVTKAENEKQQAIAEEKSHKQKIIIWSVDFGLFLVLVFAGFIFRSLRITRKQKNIIELQKNEVSRQKEIADNQRIIAEELREISEKQKHMVEEKQKEIVDSITYAKRIQTALLTSDEYIRNNLPAEHFILFKPKDIVSGDFYWALCTPPSLGEPGQGLFYFATADCTGHGVPGAFMSMLNISYLNENVIERGIRMPHDVLNAQRIEIIKALNPPGSTDVSKDGMDCILCVYDFDKMLLHFALANNPLWLVRNMELIEYKPDKMPVGKYIEEMSPFTLQTIEFQKGDIIYTSTDGFADQFGDNGKKLMKKIFKEELLKIHLQPMSDQKEHLNKFFENWKGNFEQVDDVTIIGIRI